MGLRLRSIKAAIFLSSAAAAQGVAAVVSKRAVEELPAAESLLILLLAGLVLHDRLGRPVMVVMVVAMAGVVLIVVQPALAAPSRACG